MNVKSVLLLPVKVVVLALILTACYSVAGRVSGLGRYGPANPAATPKSEAVKPKPLSEMRFHPDVNALTAPPQPAPEPPPNPSRVLRLLFVASLFQTLVLTYLIRRSPRARGKLMTGVFVAFFGAAFLPAALESTVYLGSRFPGLGMRMLLAGLITAGLFSPVAVLILYGFDRGSEGFADRPTGAAWKAAAVVLAFLAVYYTCGYYIAWQSPYVRDYYGGTDPGSFLKQLAAVWSTTPWMYLFQALRGLLYFFVGLSVARMFKGGALENAIATALLFSVVGSAQLILPNPLMPAAVAKIHLVETLIGNFVFGAFTGGLLGRTDATLKERG